MLSNVSMFGISSNLTAPVAPVVETGHVSGWVGVGGPGQGPGGQPEWIQVGLSSAPGIGMRLYYEVARPDQAVEFVQVKSTVAPGETHRVAVLEMHGRDNYWRVWVGGAPVTDPILLPQSHGVLTSMAMGESWSLGATACNRFVYGFDGITVAAQPGGSWHPLSAAHFVKNPGFQIVRSPSGFVAATKAAPATP
jgi:hypothetical protein